MNSKECNHNKHPTFAIKFFANSKHYKISKSIKHQETLKKNTMNKLYKAFQHMSQGVNIDHIS